MRLYLMRHAQAEKSGEEASEELGALTTKGRKRARRVARYLRDHDERPDRVFVSPLACAVQTAEIVHREMGLGEPVAILPALSPHGDPAAVIAALAQAPMRSALLVGHEPLLSRLAAGLLPTDLWRYEMARSMVLSIRLKPVGQARIRFVLDPKDLQVWTHP